MVALMDKPAGSAVHKILLSIANDYPQVCRCGGRGEGIIWDCFREKGPNTCFFKILICIF